MRDLRSYYRENLQNTLDYINEQLAAADDPNLRPGEREGLLYAALVIAQIDIQTVLEVEASHA
jgi:hypothetical protein